MGNMLKLSEGASLGLHAMAIIAKNTGENLKTENIARELDGSANHLSKVMQRLVRAGLAKSVRGPAGGFQLARPAEEISLLEIYEEIEGEFRPAECMLSKKICDGSICICGDVLRNINKIFYDHFKSTKLSQLVNVVQK